jgi:hypothetical protein
MVHSLLHGRRVRHNLLCHRLCFLLRSLPHVLRCMQLRLINGCVPLGGWDRGVRDVARRASGRGGSTAAHPCVRCRYLPFSSAWKSFLHWLFLIQTLRLGAVIVDVQVGAQSIDTALLLTDEWWRGRLVELKAILCSMIRLH